MHRRVIISSCFLLMCVLPLTAKEKKILITEDVLRAESVFVMADPDAGVEVSDPLANRNARVDVQNALRKWGRFRFETDPYMADLVIVVRRGNGKMVRQTIGGLPISNVPVMGPSSNPGDASNSRPVNGYPGGSRGNSRERMDPSPQMEVGAPDDMFMVYRGHYDDATSRPTVWRYSAKDALRAPAVRAVEEFRKAIDEAEKQRAAKP